MFSIWCPQSCHHLASHCKTNCIQFENNKTNGIVFQIYISVSFELFMRLIIDSFFWYLCFFCYLYLTYQELSLACSSGMHSSGDKEWNYVWILLQWRTRAATIYLSHKSDNAPVPYPTMHYFVTEMYAHVHISVTKWCIAGYGTGALWDLCNMSLYIHSEI